MKGRQLEWAAIRVFDIKHIKGLEFEAAFFVSLDRLALLYPDLIGNYLYVGATRAAQSWALPAKRNCREITGKR